MRRIIIKVDANTDDCERGEINIGGSVLGSFEIAA